MFAVVYTFSVKPGQSAKFIEAWEELTRLIYSYEGSLGSRLHTLSEHEYLAYAQWINKKTWQESGKNLPPQADKWRKAMRLACDSIETRFELPVVSDFLKKETF